VKVLDSSGNLKKQWSQEETLKHFEGDVYKVSQHDRNNYWGRALKELEYKPVKQWTYGRKNVKREAKHKIVCPECGITKMMQSERAKYCSRACQYIASSRRLGRVKREKREQNAKSGNSIPS
tara:strand:- start:458 stop:823 length:366 start_codon:yes stop_codon:yes gene_type:complete